MDTNRGHELRLNFYVQCASWWEAQLRHCGETGCLIRLGYLSKLEDITRRAESRSPVGLEAGGVRRLSRLEDFSPVVCLRKLKPEGSRQIVGYLHFWRFKPRAKFTRTFVLEPRNHLRQQEYDFLGELRVTVTNFFPSLD